MARYTGPACKLCRREGKKLYLKGDRCVSGKCALERRTSAPGQHGADVKKMREYGMQLREKQTAKRYYGVLEAQFANYYKEADRREGMTGENLLILLERRLDNVVYRMGIGVSRSQSRQLVNHGHITVNGKTLNIPSYQVKVGDVIGVKENKQDNKFFSELKQMKKPTNLPKWLDFDTATLSGKIISKPQREDIDMNIQEHMIVELYSK